MRVLVQRSKEASVSIAGNIVGSIEHGMVALVGFTATDTIDTIEEMVDKVIHLRIFDDEAGIMNRSLLDTNGQILSVSQFTLYADTKKGRRPSYIKALNGKEAVKLYDIWNQKLKEKKIEVETGAFGADMQVRLVNDGPVTILLEK